MPVEIRAAEFPQDEPGIAAIDTAFTTETIFDIEIGPRALKLIETPIPPRLKRFVIYDLGQDWRQWDEAHLATDDGRIVGFVASSYQFWNRRVVLWHIYVDPPYRKRGIGDRLLAKVFERADREKALAIFFETSNLNAPAIAWYERKGFSLGGADTALYNAAKEADEKGLFFVKPMPGA